jgi:hypothetical protein
MDRKELLAPAAVLFREQGRLIRLPESQTIVFVGDTHGDREATEIVLARYLLPGHVIVFLGDYVDRGPDSAGNLALLLQTKLSHPQRLFLLMGNHEAWAASPFTPADFWEGLGPQNAPTYAETLSLLPFAAYHPRRVLALHGALPDVASLEEIETVRLGSANWRKITWGDWADAAGYVLDPGSLGRPTFGRDYFREISSRLGLRALLRSHQPFVPTYLFGDRCLTLFTSKAYGGSERRVALLRPEKSLRSARDLELVSL